jgi:hypothetical protein
VVTAAEVPQCRAQEDGGSELDAAQSWEGFAHRQPAPGLPPGLECGFQPLQALGGLGHGAHVLRAHELLGRGRTPHLGEPAQRGGAPGGPAFVATVRAEQAGLAADLRTSEGIAVAFVRRS